MIPPSITTDLVRIDKWLWAARFYKTRSLAAEAVDAGHVKVNGSRCKRARSIRVGDRIEITRGADATEVVVLEVSAHRGPASNAQAMYAESAESLERKQHARAQRFAAGAAAEVSSSRPTKRDRRRLERWRNNG